MKWNTASRCINLFSINMSELSMVYLLISGKWKQCCVWLHELGDDIVSHLRLPVSWQVTERQPISDKITLIPTNHMSLNIMELILNTWEVNIETQSALRSGNMLWERLIRKDKHIQPVHESCFSSHAQSLHYLAQKSISWFVTIYCRKMPKMT